MEIFGIYIALNDNWVMWAIFFIVMLSRDLRIKRRKIGDVFIPMTRRDRLYFIGRDISVCSIPFFDWPPIIFIILVLSAVFFWYKIAMTGKVKVIYDSDMSLEEKRQAVFSEFLLQIITGLSIIIVCILIIITLLIGR